MTIEGVEPSQLTGLEESRAAAFTAFTDLIAYPVRAVGEIIDAGPESLYPLEASRERLESLRTIASWAGAEIEWIEEQPREGQPWDILYASASDREGKVWHTVPTEEDARRWVKERGGGAIFGYLKVRQRSTLDE